MTRRRDLIEESRQALAAGHERAAQLAGDLAAIPGWLAVGDPARHADAGDRQLAQQAQQLRAELADVHHGLDRLYAELDALDGDRADDVHRFVEWSDWLAEVATAEQLLAELSPDPRRLFLAAEPRMSAATAQRIVQTVAANGGHVGDGQTFVTTAALSDDDVFDLEYTAWERLDPLDANHVVGVLLPLRIETRYVPRAADADPWKLRVRVYPDPVALGRPAATATVDEAKLVAACWNQANGDLSTAEGAAAFRTLAAAVGAGRAAYLLGSVAVVAGEPGFVPSGDYRSQGIRSVTYRPALPDVLQIWADSGAGLRLLGELRPDHVQIAAQADFDQSLAGLAPDKVPDLWWTSYAQAVQVGLAGEVTLDGRDVRVLMVTGLGGADAGPTFAALADNGRLGVVAPMSPTNTVAGTPAADLGLDPSSWLEVAQENAGSSHANSAGWVAGRQLLAGAPTPELTLLDVAQPLVTALWPVLWQRYLKDVADTGELTYRFGDWAARLVAPLGALPAVRVGDVPYGLLPASDLDAWRAAPTDPVFEPTVRAVVRTVLDTWVTAAEDGGTAEGATAEGLLDILGRVPVSRQIGARLRLPLELIALLRNALGVQQPAAVIGQWEAELGPLHDIRTSVLRRYGTFGYVDPDRSRERGFGQAVRRFLGMWWEALAHDEQEGGEPLLARLIRHSLLLTQAEVNRLNPDAWPGWQPPYVLPVEQAEQFVQDASNGPRVLDLPQYALDRLAEQYPPDPRVDAIVRQFRDVREAARTLLEMDDALLPGGPLAPAVAAVLDTSSHRLDPWPTALVYRRLRRFNGRGVPWHIGAYGWVDDLTPSLDPTPPTTAGLLHAPGSAQALTAAVLRDHAVHEAFEARWKIATQSDQVRLAARLADDVRLGIHLSEAIGREIERRAGEPGVVLTLRRDFPARPEQQGRRVCDGLLVLAAPAASVPAEVGSLDDLRQVLDTYGDLLVADGVHAVVSGRAPQAQAAMDAAAGLSAPPDLDVLRTQRSGTSVRTTVLVALPVPEAQDPGSPVAVADPALAALLEDEFGPAAEWDWTGGGSTVTLPELGLSIADTVLLGPGALAAMAADALGHAPDAGSRGARRHAQLGRTCSVFGAQQGLPDVVDSPDAGVPQLRDRLAALRTAADDVVQQLGANPPVLAAARRWGLPPDAAAAAALLADRIERAGTPASDATADAAELSARIRTLLAPAAALPLLCSGTLPVVHAAPGLDREWLEVVAAVRPAIARLEAHQLRTQWPAAANLPAWAAPQAGRPNHTVVVYGPAATAVDPVGIALLDDWVETVPSPKHTTYAAFGFDAPRARAPQALLLAVPPQESAPLSADTLPGIVETARRLTRARMASPDHLGDVQSAVPTSMVLVPTPAGTGLVTP